jgi:hypothetical protein
VAFECVWRQRKCLAHLCATFVCLGTIIALSFLLAFFGKAPLWAGLCWAPALLWVTATIVSGVAMALDPDREWAVSDRFAMFLGTLGLGAADLLWPWIIDGIWHPFASLHFVWNPLLMVGTVLLLAPLTGFVVGAIAWVVAALGIGCAGACAAECTAAEQSFARSVAEQSFARSVAEQSFARSVAEQSFATPAASAGPAEGGLQVQSAAGPSALAVDPAAVALAAPSASFVLTAPRAGVAPAMPAASSTSPSLIRTSNPSAVVAVVVAVPPADAEMARNAPPPAH